MREILAAIQVALPSSADVRRFGAPERRAEISAALATISDDAALLEAHAKQTHRNGQLRYLARSVARDAREVQRAYAQQDDDRAAFLLWKVTENCIVCHTRLPSDEDSPLSEGLVGDGVLDGLPPEEQAALLIATRRFDDALSTLEELLVDPLEHPATLLGPLTDYLVVSLRVKGDYRRPIPTLERFAARRDLWARLRADVETWIAALPGLRERAAGAGDLETGRALVEEGLDMIVLPGDRAPLAHLVAGSAVLERVIDARTAPAPQLAEAYYWLGIVEARIGRNYWVTPAPFLFETAIRLAPGAIAARRAYSMLEQELLLAYEGSDEEELPAEDARRLADLRGLIDAATTD
jgi:hypothetical protein